MFAKDSVKRMKTNHTLRENIFKTHPRKAYYPKYTNNT